jgi:predicted PurR-regulated permease PerM
MPQQRLAKAVRILLVLILLVVILVYAKPFLVPLAFAGIFSLLLLPVARWIEKRGINKAVATLLTLLAFLSVFAALFFFIGWQVSNITEDASQMEQQFSQKLQQLKMSVSKTFGVSPEKQQQIMKQQQQQAPGKTSSLITSVLSGFGLFLTNALLMLVYLFLLLYYRGHVKAAILRFVPEGQRGNAETIMHDSQRVTYKYMTGLGLMIVSLWIMYGIGFSISGVKNALFFAVLCGVLEIIPFVGNLAGTLLTMGMALSQGGSTNMLIGIAVTYGVVQFIQSYLIEPLVVGSKVNINPLFTIAGIVAGEQVWGIPGMILSIPLLGMAKIICDRVEPLRPIGFLIGEDGKKEKGNGFMDKIKKFFGKAPKHKD